ncbi:MAG: sulfotransferase family protein [Chloroflexota bacterium]|nr:sulfotransferase family protein [Chloroflexota bacterium]
MSALTPVGIPSPTLDVIGAGLGRTGTLSLHAALERLSFAPCEHMTNCFAHPERFALWLEAARSKRAAEPIDWRPLFTGYRATVDWPGAYFWRELTESHPEAKVILTVRDPQRWYDSARATIYTATQARTATRAARLLYGLLAWLDPRAGRGFRTVQETVWEGTLGGQFDDRDQALRMFAAHNEEVQATILTDRLLVFDVKQGWEPLCAFLGVPVPTGEPFPHVNDAADFTRRQQDQYIHIARALLPAAGCAIAGGILALMLEIKRRPKKMKLRADSPSRVHPPSY